MTWLPGIVTFPFLHANFAHIAGNAGIAVVLVFLIGLSGRRALVASSGIIVLLGGVLTWIIGSGVIVGASGLIYGWVAYLVVRGFFNKSLLQILVGIGLGIAYAGMIVGFFPQPMISWQAHLCGAVAGVAAAKLTAPDHSADPSPRPIAAV
nr:rhomboid family intramembrane serine protease [Corynebacterium mendelii]